MGFQLPSPQLMREFPPDFWNINSITFWVENEALIQLLKEDI